MLNQSCSNRCAEVFSGIRRSHLCDGSILADGPNLGFDPFVRRRLILGKQTKLGNQQPDAMGQFRNVTGRSLLDC